MLELVQQVVQERLLAPLLGEALEIVDDEDHLGTVGHEQTLRTGHFNGLPQTSFPQDLAGGQA